MKNYAETAERGNTDVTQVDAIHVDNPMFHRWTQFKQHTNVVQMVIMVIG